MELGAIILYKSVTYYILDCCRTNGFEQEFFPAEVTWEN
jgi:hypothetical protein